MRRLSEDAKPLSNVELEVHRNLLRNHAPPTQTGSTNTVIRHIPRDRDHQRKILETQLRMRMRRRTPYSQPGTETDLAEESRSTTRVTATNAAIPHTPLPGLSTTSPFLTRLSPEARHVYTRSLSQPASLLRAHSAAIRPSTSTAANMSTGRRLMLQRLASFMAASATGSNSGGSVQDTRSNLPP